jgi:hypothetical protein
VVAAKLIRPAPPAAALVACSSPVPLPDRNLDAGETVSLWGRDRAALRICEARRAAAAAALEE